MPTTSVQNFPVNYSQWAWQLGVLLQFLLNFSKHSCTYVASSPGSRNGWKRSTRLLSVSRIFSEIWPTIWPSLVTATACLLTELSGSRFNVSSSPMTGIQTLQYTWCPRTNNENSKDPTLTWTAISPTRACKYTMEQDRYNRTERD